MFRELIRKNRELPREECVSLLKAEKRGVLSVLGEGGYPYGMPMNHYYCEEDGRLYFHSGNAGHRLDALRKCDKVSFCVYDEGYCKEGEWALNVKSVIAFGRIELVSDLDRIAAITAELSRKFTSDEDYIRNEIEKHAHRTLLLVMTVEHLCGKLVEES